MGFSDAPAGHMDKAALSAYRKEYQHKYLRNPKVPHDFPRGVFPLGREEKKHPPDAPEGKGGSPKGLYRIWNWALRTAWSGKPGPELDAAWGQLRMWIKTIVALNAAADTFNADQQKKSLDGATELIQKKGGGDSNEAAQTLHAAAGMTQDGMVYRGISWLTEETIDYYAGMGAGDIVPVVQLTSTTISEDVAKKFLNQKSPHVMIWGIQNVGQKAKAAQATPSSWFGGKSDFQQAMDNVEDGAVLSMWEVSEYPEEVELLKPMCERLMLSGPPEWRERPE
eukprot:gene33133-2095_t